MKELDVFAAPLGPSVPAQRAGEEWWAILPIEAIAEPTSVELRLRATLTRGSETTASLATIDLQPALSPVSSSHAGLPSDHPAARTDLIAICMATHDPRIDLFERQVESIRAQSWDNWVCIVSDDASPPERLDEIRRVLGDDPRFRLLPSASRLGFYENFERALALAPPEASFVALSDHDDRWYPDKLERLASSLRDEDSLSYSDMRIVTPEGELLSDTYWKHRRNNSTDLESLLIGNTITGAATLFRRSLLDLALPFPPRVGDAYHDHWLALVALASGSVRYLDQPLHDYVQHPGAVIGFASANAGLEGDRGRLARLPVITRRLASRVIRPEARRRYFTDYCRIALAATVLELRCGESMSEEKRAAAATIRAADGSPRAAAGLAVRSLRRGNQTMGVDRSVLAGLAWSRLARSRH